MMSLHNMRSSRPWVTTNNFWGRDEVTYRNGSELKWVIKRGVIGPKLKWVIRDGIRLSWFIRSGFELVIEGEKVKTGS